MLDYEKLHRIEARVARLADARKTRHDRYRERVAESKQLRIDAVWQAHPDYQTRQLAELVALDADELREAGVDAKTLQRAAFERRLADEELRGDPQEDAAFAALSQLLNSLRAYAGEPQ
jgi:hypothetical protein